MPRKYARYAKHLAFNEARELVRTLGLKSASEYFQLQGKKSLHLPSHPENTYKEEGWNGWEDYIGETFKKQIYKSTTMPFEEARAIVRAMNISSVQEWRLLVRTQGVPEGMPTVPDYTYKDSGWTGWRDFLGTKEFLPYEEAREYVKQLNIRTSTEWEEHMYGGRRPSFIPSCPQKQYKGKGWQGWKHFLNPDL